jgi:hypothetical protein
MGKACQYEMAQGVWNVRFWARTALVWFWF